MGCSGSKRTRSLCDNPPSVTCVEPCPSPPPLLRRTSTDAMPDEKSSHRRSVMNGGGDQVGNHEEDNDNTMMDTTISPLLVGRLPAHLFLNGYLVLRHLGEGTTSTVTLAWSYMSSRLVAIKSIPFAASTSLQDHRGTSLATPYRIQHLHANDEVAALESLDHPNICRVYDVIESRDEMCLVLEYLEGGAVQPPAGLDPHLRRLYPNTVARGIFLQLLDALEYIHSHNMIHGDVKPLNLVYASTGVVKLIDLGSVLRVGPPGDDAVTSVHASPAFMPPPLARGDSMSGRSADIWMAAVTLFMLVTDRVPFGRANDPPFIMYSALTAMDEVVFHEEEHARLDPSLVHLLTSMLAKSDDRLADLTMVRKHPWLVTGIDDDVVNRDHEQAGNDSEKGENNRRSKIKDRARVASTTLARSLSKMARSGTTRSFVTGSTIVHQNERVSNVFLILSGDVALSCSAHSWIAGLEQEGSVDSDASSKVKAVAAATTRTPHRHAVRLETAPMSCPPITVAKQDEQNDLPTVHTTSENDNDGDRHTKQDDDDDDRHHENPSHPSSRERLRGGVGIQNPHDHRRPPQPPWGPLPPTRDPPPSQPPLTSIREVPSLSTGMGYSAFVEHQQRSHPVPFSVLQSPRGGLWEDPTSDNGVPSQIFVSHFGETRPDEWRRSGTSWRRARDNSCGDDDEDDGNEDMEKTMFTSLDAERVSSSRLNHNQVAMALFDELYAALQRQHRFPPRTRVEAVPLMMDELAQYTLTCRDDQLERLLTAGLLARIYRFPRGDNPYPSQATLRHYEVHLRRHAAKAAAAVGSPEDGTNAVQGRAFFSHVPHPFMVLGPRDIIAPGEVHSVLHAPDTSTTSTYTATALTHVTCVVLSLELWRMTLGDHEALMAHVQLGQAELAGKRCQAEAQDRFSRVHEVISKRDSVVWRRLLEGWCG